MSAAFFDTSLPMIPMAMPMSAFLITGLSFTPSPVTATTWPCCWQCSTMRSFYWGDVLHSITTLHAMAWSVMG